MAIFWFSNRFTTVLFFLHKFILSLKIYLRFKNNKIVYLKNSLDKGVYFALHKFWFLLL